MSDAESLLLVVALVYLSECFHWTRREAVAFSRWVGRRFRAIHPGRWGGNDRGGLVLAPPLPPPGELFLCEPWPASIAPAGVLAYVAATIHPGGRSRQEERWVRFADLGPVESEEKAVRASGRVLARTGSPRAARALRSRLEAFGRLPEAMRGPAIERDLEEALDPARVEQRLAEYRAATTRLSWPGSALFLLVFAVAPLAGATLGLAVSWRVLLSLFLCLLGWTVIEYRRAHSRLWPEERGERRAGTALLLLTPLRAVRVRDLLSRDLLAVHHPLAVARVLLDREPFEELARKVLLDLHHPIDPPCPAVDDEAVVAERWYRERLTRAVERVVAGAGIDVEQALRPPSPEASDCRAYCPRCRVQFTRADARCERCGNLEVVPFAARRG